MLKSKSKSPTKKKYLAIIPARSGSKGIKNKNIVKLDKKPLIHYTLKSAIETKAIDKIFVSTDSKDIQELIKNYHPASCPILRPKNISRDNSRAEDYVDHSLKFLSEKESYEPDIVIILQPTSPLRGSNHIREAVKKFEKNYKIADSLVSVTEVPHLSSPESVMIKKNKYVLPFDKKNIKKNLRQEKSIFYARNSAIYIFKRDTFLKYGNFYGKNIIHYKMDKFSSIDIDDTDDLSLAEYYKAKEKGK